jgi:hypothetical protein
MIVRAKCVTEGCERENVVMAAGSLFFEKAGVEEIREDIKGKALLKSPPRKVSAPLNGKPVGRKKTSARVLKVSGPMLGGQRKTSTKKTGQRKRVSGKR